jgi:hypothetical protein
MIVKIDDQLTARAVDRGADGIQVQLQRSDGQSVFESTAQAVPGEHVRWSETYHLGVERRTDQLPVSSSLLLSNEPRESVTLEGAVWTTAFVHAQLAAATRGDKAVGDQSGCDIPGIGDDVSCSNKGGCCDAHDACYRDNHCTRESWSEEHDSLCQTLCNDAVKRCLLRSESTPGKSVCCAAGTCGDDSTRQTSTDARVSSATLDGGVPSDGGLKNDGGVAKDGGVKHDSGVKKDGGASPDAGPIKIKDASVGVGSSDSTNVPGVSTGFVPASGRTSPMANPTTYPTTNPSVDSGTVSWPYPQVDNTGGLDPELYPVEDDDLGGDDEYADDDYDDDGELSDDDSDETEDDDTYE